ncbi:hypothetical protein CEH05_05785 [Halobacillus halophilus]|nr:hypothetical protein CEH05_05785 [Halobacillus halophilus]
MWKIPAIEIFVADPSGGEGNDETPAGEGARRDPTGSETSEEACQFPRRKVFKCGITPKDTTSISRPSKGLWFFNPLMSGLCLECLGDGTRRVVSAATLIKFLATDSDYLETESSTIRPFSLIRL